MFLLSELILKILHVNIDLWKSPFWGSSAPLPLFIPCFWPEMTFNFVSSHPLWLLSSLNGSFVVERYKVISPLSVI